jgi:hypothetical protein
MTETLFALVPAYGAGIVFAITLISCLGVPVPGSLALLAAGAFAASGDMSISAGITAGFAGAVIGDQLGYGIGARGGRLAERLTARPGMAALLDQAHAHRREQRLGQDHQHARRIEREPEPPAGRHVRRPDPGRRAHGKPRDRPAQPLRDGPAHRCHRKQRDPRAFGQVERELRRAGEAEVRAADQHHRPRVEPHERVHRREMMVDAPAEKPEPDQQRCRNRGQAFLEIGRVLVGDLVHRHAARAQRRGGGDRIHVADHRREGAPIRQRHVATAVRRHRHGRQRQRPAQLPRLHRPAADQRHRPVGPVQDAGHCQVWMATAEIAFWGEPSISRSE